MQHAVGWVAVVVLLASAAPAAVTVERFTPQGEAKQVQQVTVVFSEPMVHFGDLRELIPPFAVTCPVPGSGRWVDTRTWVYDFERQLPGGIRCTLRARTDLQSVAARRPASTIWLEFTTGGPAVVRSLPLEGSDDIDEQQAFVLGLDGEATPDSILAHTGIEVPGIAERIGVTLVEGGERDTIVAGLPYWLKPEEPFVIVRARQTLPNATAVRLVWGAGITSPTGVATSRDQVLEFTTRPRFAAEVSCERENAKAGCTPLTPITVRFTAPVAWAQAAQARLTGADAQAHAPETPDPPAESVTRLTFAPPFPPDATLRLALPADLRDDAGRPLDAGGEATVRIAPYPPLAKFAARFGLLEAHADPALPITIRNLDPEVPGTEVRATRPRPSGWRATVQELYARLGGATTRVERVEDVLPWLRRLATARRDRSLFADLPADVTPRRFTLPQPEGPETMQVVGLPFDAPGLYLVELTSPRLGAALLGTDQPLYVPAGALVTNLAVHFKWGRENALAWVTRLDDATPVEGARVTVQDCTGAVLATGVSDAQGLARFTGLPAPDRAATCPDAQRFEGFTGIDYRDHASAPALTGLESGLLVLAETTGDLSFVHTSWQRGIEPWRFNLPGAPWDGPVVAHTIFDRTLFRLGETVHMKHVLRAQTLAGFAAVPDAERPVQTIVRHLGSNERYELPLTWGADALAEQTWTIPAAAKLGQYAVVLARADGSERQSGTFRVEQFRVPLMRATVQLPDAALVGATTVPVDVAVQYLAGGPAAELPVVLRAQLRERALPVDEAFEDFTFAAGAVREGLVREDQSQPQEPAGAAASPVLSRQELTLDAAGTARAHLTGLPAIDAPRELLAEIEYRDPNGEVQTAAARVPLWPAAVAAGIAAEHWAGSEDGLLVEVAAIDPHGRPAANVPVEIDAFRRRTYAHRKRLVGGFYGYEHIEDTRPLATLCRGRTDTLGRFACRAAPPGDGHLIVQARVHDAEGRTAATHTDVYVDAPDPLGFPVEASDRMDLVPERREYAPGETARLQVRMPFRAATALVTVEREGIAEAQVVALDGGAPRVEVPIAGQYAPNAFVSVLAVRGRVAGTQPTALVDLGKPAFRLGLAELRIGWRAHQLDVRVRADRDTYRVRDTARVDITVRTPDGAPLPAGSEVAVAAVDEGLLELQPNDSWELLAAMMGRRGYDVRTATAQLEVIGKRHYGRKVLPAGGGGGRQATRELFDTLLLWAARVPLDARGTAQVEVPLGDALSAFRIVAVATAGLDRFGTGSTEVRTTQELMLLSGLPPVVRDGDRFAAQFTLRNTTDAPLAVDATLEVTAADAPAPPIAGAAQSVTLAAGEARVIAWPVEAPPAGDALVYTVEARAGAHTDRLRVTQQLRPAVPTRTLQATLLRADQPLRLPVARPADALPDRGGLEVGAAASLGGLTAGVAQYLRDFPYTCLEQQVSIAVGLQDAARWQAISAALPSYADGDGLLKYFPTLHTGSEVLTAYVLAIAHAAGLPLPALVREKMIDGLQAFVAGRISRDSALRAPDLTVRKLAAIAALARAEAFTPELLDGLTIEPALWPTAALLDWWDVVQRLPPSPERDAQRAAVEQQLRTRLDVQGTLLRFRGETGDALWWLMGSPDVNATRLLLHVAEFGVWRDDAGRIARGALARQQRGHWDTTVANAWGAVALRRFAAAFEGEPVTGTTAVTLGAAHGTFDWSAPPALLHFDWPPDAAELTVTQQGSGAPWVTIASRAAVPLREPLSSGYRVTRTVTPLEPRAPGQLSRGDRLRVRLEIAATADMTWVVVDDPIPAGASHLGTGLARDRQVDDGAPAGDVATPDFVERRFDAWRGYFQFLPAGQTVVEYEIRLNQSGSFRLPPTRVAALYAPELFAELPNAPVEVVE